MNAFRRAGITANPIEGGDMPRARAVTNFMRWLVFTQIPHFEREVELLANYYCEKGVCLAGQFWENYQEKTLKQLDLTDLEKVAPGASQYLQDKSMDKEFVLLIKQFFPDVSDKKAKKMVKELQEDGKTSIPIVSKEYSRPVIRAFTLDEDIFLHPSATDIENAPGVYRVQYFMPHQLRAFAATEGWDANWVEDAIQTCKGRRIAITPDQNPTPVTRNIINQAERFTELIGVVFAYEKLSDEDGVPGIYLTVFHPELPASASKGHEGFAKFGLLGYNHGKYPFTLFRREFLSRRVHDSRGIPEVARGYQDIIKACRDSGIDAMSLSVIPPLMHPQGRAPTEWGPGARIAYKRDPMEFRFGDRPVLDGTRIQVEQEITKDYKSYFGMSDPALDPAEAAAKQQNDINKFLGCIAESLEQVWSLYQQYGKDEVAFRVMGTADQNLCHFEKGDKDEEYDIYLVYDVASSDLEKQKEKFSTINEIVQTADRYGMIDHAKYLPWAIGCIDPNAAETFILPQEAGQAKAVSEEQAACSKLYSGMDVDIDLGSSPQIGQQVMQQWMQSPDVQQRYNSDEPFKERVDKRYKQYQMQLMQQQNAKIGKYGA
jgi:hypothetical protein